MVAILKSHWLDPFSSVQQDLVCLFTGKVAPPKIQQDLLAARAVEEKAYGKFHDTIPKAKLQTFTDLNKKVQVKSKTSKEITLKMNLETFHPNTRCSSEENSF